MRQQFLIQNDKQNKELVIQEFAEIDKNVFTQLCRETYSAKEIRSAVKSGLKTLIGVLRTKNFYPPGLIAEQLADSIAHLVRSRTTDTVEIHFDDRNFFAEFVEKAAELEVYDEKDEEFETEPEIETDEVDDLIGEDQHFTDKDSSIPLDDEESYDTEIES